MKRPRALAILLLLVLLLMPRPAGADSRDPSTLLPTTITSVDITFQYLYDPPTVAHTVAGRISNPADVQNLVNTFNSLTGPPPGRFCSPFTGHATLIYNDVIGIT